MTRGATGIGAGKVAYAVAKSNTGASSRTGSLLIAAQPFTIVQRGLSTTPVVAIASPTNASTWRTARRSITLSGIALDDRSVASVTWESDRGGRGAATGTTSWETDVALKSGRNVISVTATDSAGNRSIAILTVRRE